MAITKIWCHKRQMERKSVSDVKKSVSDGIYYALNPQKTTLEGMKRIAEAEPDGIVAAVFNSLQKGVDYATDEEKTIKQKAELENCFSRDDECKFVTGINCSGNENAVDEFVITKQQWDNLEPEITHFHGVQSFKGYECTPETAHEIGVELARRLWGDRFQVVVCTHINKENVHNHFIVNATSFVDGKRFYDNNQTYYKMRYENDILCEKYGLSVVNTAKSKRTKGRSYYYHKMDKAGAPTRLNIAKEAIDIAVSKATSIDELADILYEMEFECDFSTNHKHWTLRSFGWDKCIRLTRLENAFGDDYSKLGIYNRLGIERTAHQDEVSNVHRYKTVPERNNTKYYATGRNLHRTKPFATGIYAYYIKWLYLLGALPKRRRNYSARYAACISHLVRDDVLNIQNILDESKLIAKHHIETGDELFSLQSDLQRQADELKQAAKKKNISPEERQKLQEEIRKKKREVKLCDYIWERSLIMAEKFETEKRFENKSDYEHEGFHYDEYDDLETYNNYDV